MLGDILGSAILLILKIAIAGSFFYHTYKAVDLTYTPDRDQNLIGKHRYFSILLLLVIIVISQNEQHKEQENKRDCSTEEITGTLLK